MANPNFKQAERKSQATFKYETLSASTRGFLFLGLAANPVDGETIQVGGSTPYVFKDTPVDPYDVAIGEGPDGPGNSVSTLQNLVTAINDELDAGIRNPEVSALFIDKWHIRIQSRALGSAGNGISVSPSDSSKYLFTETEPSFGDLPAIKERFSIAAMLPDGPLLDPECTGGDLGTGQDWYFGGGVGIVDGTKIRFTDAESAYAQQYPLAHNLVSGKEYLLQFEVSDGNEKSLQIEGVGMVTLPNGHFSIIRGAGSNPNRLLFTALNSGQGGSANQFVGDIYNISMKEVNAPVAVTDQPGNETLHVEGTLTKQYFRWRVYVGEDQYITDPSTAIINRIIEGGEGGALSGELAASLMPDVIEEGAYYLIVGQQSPIEVFTKIYQINYFRSRDDGGPGQINNGVDGGAIQVGTVNYNLVTELAYRDQEANELLYSDVDSFQGNFAVQLELGADSGITSAGTLPNPDARAAATQPEDNRGVTVEAITAGTAGDSIEVPQNNSGGFWYYTFTEEEGGEQEVTTLQGGLDAIASPYSPLASPYSQ